MKLTERVRYSLEHHDEMQQDTIDKLISYAYYMGREEATKDISDKYNAMIQQMRKRAKACRYNRMADKIIGTRDYIYSIDYSQDMILAFGDDETKL